MNLNKLKSQLTKAMYDYFKREYYDEDEIDDMGLFNIQTQENALDEYVDVYIYAEISVEDFIHYSEKLNTIVERYDKSAYFDIEQPGVYMARLYSDNIEQNVSINKTDLKKFGQAVVDELNSMLHFFEASVNYCKVVNGNELELAVKKDGRHSFSYSVTVDPTEEYNASILESQFLDEFVDDLYDKLVASPL